MMRRTHKQIGTDEKSVKSERGAIIVEATLSLSFFMFTMYIMLSLIQIAYVQSRISVALTCATKEVSEYVHIYYAAGIGDKMGAGGGKSTELANNVSEFLGKIGQNIGSISSEFGQYFTEAGGAVEGDNVADYIEHFLGSAAVWQLMKKNLTADGNDSAEEFLRRNHIDGGIDFSKSNFLEGGSTEGGTKQGETDKIFLGATYNIKVVELLGIKYHFHMRCWAYSNAWD